MPLFEDLGEYLSPTLDLPVAGKVYRVPSPPARVGLRLQAAWALLWAARTGGKANPADEQLVASDDGTTSLAQDALGPVYQQMLDDDLPVDVVNRAAVTAHLWIVAGEDAARRYWRSPLGEPAAPTSGASTSTGAATSTLPPGSTSGTSSPAVRSDGSPDVPA